MLRACDAASGAAHGQHTLEGGMGRQHTIASGLGSTVQARANAEVRNGWYWACCMVMLGWGYERRRPCAVDLQKSYEGRGRSNE